jgi:hypothetical protein
MDTIKFLTETAQVFNLENLLYPAFDNFCPVVSARRLTVD